MMQQVATSSSKLAANALPFDTSSENLYSKDGIAGLDSPRSAFEKAFVTAEQGAFAKEKGRDDAKLRVKERAFTQPVERPSQPNNHADDAVSQAKQRTGESTIESATHERTQAGSAEQSQAHAQSQGSNPNAAADESASANTQKENDAQLGELNQDEPIKDLVGAGNKADETAKISDLTGTVNSLRPETALETVAGSEFDYIDFVTEIQSLSDTSSLANENISDSISEEQGDALATLNLNQDELQVILDAQHAGVDLTDNLSDDQLAKLNDVINRMLGQYHDQTKPANELVIDVDNGSELDAELLQTLLAQGTGSETDINNIAAKQANAENLAPSTLQQMNTEQSVLKSSKYAANNTDLLAVDANIDATASKVNQTEDILTTRADTSALDTNTQAQQIALENSQDTARTLSTLAEFGQRVTDSKSGLITPIEVKPNSNDASESVKQLALLDERSQTNIIENIKSRVEKFAADLSGDNAKGSEFVAAMQSGLKEFKEQLQSGREPGIDLKALVSDAIAKANVEIPTQNQPKVDSALSQFSGILNLANSVNQSAQAQSHQLFGLTEAQLAKESNVLHAEGTKLAQQTPSNFDKAVNIFKPEGQQQLAEKVRWMVNARNPAAEIRLDPPELGAMQIKVNMTADAAAVSFTVQSAQAKDALDQALPKLRDMLQEQGIELGQSSVEQQASGQSDTQDNPSSNASSRSAAQVDAADEMQDASSQVIEQRVAGSSLGGIDYYA